MKKTLKKIPKFSLLLAALAASLVLLLEAYATKLILAAVVFAAVVWLTRNWKLSRRIGRGIEQEPENKEKGKPSWFHY